MSILTPRVCSTTTIAKQLESTRSNYCTKRQSWEKIDEIYERLSDDDKATRDAENDTNRESFQLRQHRGCLTTPDLGGIDVIRH